MKPVVFALVLPLLALAACKPEVAAEKPLPVAMTETAVGHYCQMDVLEHDGPKAQVHLSHLDHPFWFTQVRDAIVFQRLPEETAKISAIYVSDMGATTNWADPGAENWVDADAAHFVINSTRAGGMGAPEAVPFSDQAVAEAFAAEHGGDVMKLADIPDDYVLAPVEVDPLASVEIGSTQ